MTWNPATLVCHPPTACAERVCAHKDSCILCAGSGTHNAPRLLQNLLLQHRSLSLSDITTSHSSTPCDMLGEMFKGKLEITTPVLLPCQPQSSGPSFCQILYFYISCNARF